MHGDRFPNLPDRPALDGRSAPARILMVDGGLERRLLVELAIQCESIVINHADTGPSALVRMAESRPDLVLLDVDLPDMNALEVMTRMRHDDAGVAVILLSEHSVESERVLGLELGADDYVEKSFSTRELAARVRTVLRRCSRGQGPAQIVAGPLRIQVAERRVALNGEVLPLTPKEFDLLVFLASSAPARVFSRDELLQQVWGSSADWQDPATVTEHVRRLRLRIETDATRPQLLQTVRGVGYRFDPAAA